MVTGSCAGQCTSRPGCDAGARPRPRCLATHARARSASRRGGRAVATDFAARAEAKGQPWALARAARCSRPRTSSRIARGGAPPARADARRLRDRAHPARRELHAALATFDRLGARTWAAQTEAELTASGETARRRDVSTLDQLTPQERQIAGLLAAGSTTREAAAAVFLSPKTIEHDPRHVYRKLSIHSRESSRWRCAANAPTFPAGARRPCRRARRAAWRRAPAVRARCRRPSPAGARAARPRRAGRAPRGTRPRGPSGRGR